MKTISNRYKITAFRKTDEGSPFYAVGQCEEEKKYV